MLPRRTLLRAAAAAPLTAVLGCGHAEAAGPVLRTTRHSAARGRTVDLVVVRPAGPRTPLPVVLALHGRGASPRTFLDLGLQRAVDATGTYAVAAVSGGDAYWHRRGDDDPQAMLEHEVPGWLAELGLGPVRGALGISMGGFGALLWARRTAHPVAVLSPALFLDWGQARARHAFSSQADWEAAEPLRHLPALHGHGLGVWCGAQDPFAPAARRLAHGTHAAVASFGPGAHDAAFWGAELPTAARFLASRVA
ncbi:S-formylglutathione hydrolase FrmB [Motilibacter rhizosphaerae]|uniref:Acyl-CoA:diacylglycerol acyltransferase n=1 Tax=Motilibacter rhizosphaerae TaxID=598652 RepID=A0A4Q7NQN7_9ACTN|nr:alpha/beta hydrolase-fold protein [Motilibacter rhizosphaerae]RZS87543.1 S-formylglutathione hydrolase FrmB [Motilibacter rhizosphaerae]